ncbi:MAG: hypothetical protein HND46_01680 [Chloroflexi bacterium]|nr:hypothetical protein [Chloroflexota bacterium]
MAQIQQSTSPRRNSNLFNPLWLLWLIPAAAVIVSIANYFGWFYFDGVIPKFDSLRWELFTNWAGRELDDVLVWWLLVTLAGAAVFPLMFRLMSGLSDRGYTLARAAGLMLIGYIFWFLASIGVLRNEVGGMAFAWIVVIILSLVAWFRGSDRPSGAELGAWLREHLPLIIFTEVLFLGAMIIWAFVQAHNPEITSTEKPMEMAFINGVRNSATFPPKDPWMAGYAISYYYFGYVITASLADLSGVTTGIAFKLVNPLLFAMTLTGILGITYNLVRAGGHLRNWRVGNRHAALATGLLAAFFITIMGNLGTLLVEMPYRGYTAETPIIKDIVNADYFDFWDVRDRTGPFMVQNVTDPQTGLPAVHLLDTDTYVSPEDPITQNYVFAPDEDRDGIPNWDDTDDAELEEAGNHWEYWWWFKQSRLVHDKKFNGGYEEAITEFPQFSFILGDNHPHVLALPFTLLIIGLAASLAMRPTKLANWEIVVYGVFFGGIIFMNAWDALYLGLLVGAEALRRLMHNGRLNGFGELGRVITLETRRKQNLYLLGPVFIVLLLFFAPSDTLGDGLSIGEILIGLILVAPVTLIVNWALDDNDWGSVVRLGGSLMILFVLFYLPWLVSFTSQSQGMSVNLIYPTRSQQLFLQFGIFGLMILPFVLQQMGRAGRRIRYGAVIGLILLGLIFAIGVPLFSAYIVDSRTCPLQKGQEGLIVGLAEPARSNCQARFRLFGELRDDTEVRQVKLLGQDLGELSKTRLTLYTVYQRRLGALIGQIVLLTIAAIIVMRLFARNPNARDEDKPVSVINYSPGTGVALLLIAMGVVVTFVPDVIYLIDNFGNRMNTIFKLYYQSWALFSIGAAYAIFAVLNGAPNRADEENRIAPVSVFVLRGVYVVGLLYLLWAGTLYPYYAVRSRALYETNLDNQLAMIEACQSTGATDCPSIPEISLDAGPTMAQTIGDDEWKLINECFWKLDPPKNDSILIEYGGGSYSAYHANFGRFSMLTGIPTLLGWDNHERQWRGNTYEEIVGNRLQDIDLFYNTTDWQIAQDIINKYKINYIVVGNSELNSYSNSRGLAKFSALLDPICAVGNAAVYRVSPN